VWNNSKNAKNRTIKDAQTTFYKVIGAPMLMYGTENWALNRSERKKIETAGMRFVRHLSGYTLTNHARSTTISNALKIYALEERNQ
jgi:hypothetical protein